MVVEDPALAMAKQGLSRGALDDGDAEESERSDAIAGGGVGRFSRVSAPITRRAPRLVAPIHHRWTLWGGGRGFVSEG